MLLKTMKAMAGYFFVLCDHRKALQSVIGMLQSAWSR